MGQCRIGEIPNPFGEGCLPDVAYHAKKTKAKNQAKVESNQAQKSESSFEKKKARNLCELFNQPKTQQVCENLFKGARWFSSSKTIELKEPSLELKGPKGTYEPKKTDAAAIYKQDRKIKIDVSRRRPTVEPIRSSPSQPQRLGGSRKP